MLLVELIKSINNSKVGNEKNIVIGPSMGGLISRYALNYMESQNIDHDTRLYISFDAPHTGANVPIGFHGKGYLFNILETIRKFLVNKQLAISHYVCRRKMKK